MNAVETAMLDSDDSKAPSSPNQWKLGILVVMTISITPVIVSLPTVLLSGGFPPSNRGSPSPYNRTEFESFQAQLENQSQHMQGTFPNFEKDLEDIQEHMRKQAMNFKQDIQSQANKAEEKANNFEILVDEKTAQINSALELISLEHGRSAEVLEEMKKNISDIQEAKIFEEETVDDPRGQIMNVSAHMERLEVIDTRLNFTEHLVEDLRDELEEVRQEVGTNSTIN